MADERPLYYVIDAQNPKRMLLYSLVDPGLRDSWVYGRPFKKVPKSPVVVGIQPGYENADLLPYFGTPPVMSNEFYEALLAAGVDNLVVYDAILRSQDKKIQHEGYKAFNVIGLVKAADLDKTVFSPDSESRLIDATLDSLSIDPKKARGLLMFRLAEYAGAIVVHQSVKAAIEQRNFPYVVFREPEDLFS